MTVRLEGIGIWGPGMTDWAGCRAVLQGEGLSEGAECGDPPAATLSPQERRRSIATARLAIEVAGQACAAAGRQNIRDYITVFSSSGGDLATLGSICETLARDPRLLSPTRFHNSVHNAPGGYWGIASGCERASTSLSAGPASFAAGLLEAATQCAVEDAPVMLVAYDVPGPEPLGDVCGIATTFGVALALTPAGAGDAPVLALNFDPAPAAETVMQDAALEALRLANPAARCLPLLAALANRGECDVVMDGGGDASLVVTVAY